MSHVELGDELAAAAGGLLSAWGTAHLQGEMGERYWRTVRAVKSWQSAREGAVAECFECGQDVPARAVLADSDRDETAPLSDEAAARLFHATYEAFAPQMGYRTREASAVPWDEVPQANRDLMVATVHEVRAALSAARAAAEPDEPSLVDEDGACVQCGHLATSHRPDSGECTRCRGKRACYAPGIADAAAGPVGDDTAPDRGHQ